MASALMDMMAGRADLERHSQGLQRPQSSRRPPTRKACIERGDVWIDGMCVDYKVSLEREKSRKMELFLEALIINNLEAGESFSNIEKNVIATLKKLKPRFSGKWSRRPAPPPSIVKASYDQEY